MRFYVNTDIDLLEMIQLGARPVDRIQQADCLSFNPDIPNVKGKTIILNQHFENSENRINYLAKYNQIINRDKLITSYQYIPYDTSKFDIMYLSEDKIEVTSNDLELIMLDDLLISNKTIIWQ